MSWKRYFSTRIRIRSWAAESNEVDEEVELELAFPFPFPFVLFFFFFVFAAATELWSRVLDVKKHDDDDDDDDDAEYDELMISCQDGGCVPRGVSCPPPLPPLIVRQSAPPNACFSRFTPQKLCAVAQKAAKRDVLANLLCKKNQKTAKKKKKLLKK